ncbi:MAG: sigma-70 family RNA polymerase sigma factor [Polyangiaceae bacterium]|nr:sigma-70 family RNA polymerase sigma factor [Polyangiaceae bacterium]
MPPPKRPSATASRAGRATAPRLPYLVSQRTQAEGGPALDLSGTDAESNGEVALVVTQEHLRFLFSYLTLLGVRQADLEDLVQDCLCGLYRSRARFARRPQDITNWLAAIARHQVANYRARRRFTNEIPVPIEDLDELPGSAPGADALAIAGSRRKVLDELLGDMPEERMRVLIAKELLHMGFEEIAQQVGCPVSTARKRYRLAMQDLARERARWQARQRRRGLDILPILLAPLLFAKRALAAGGRGLRPVLAVIALAVGAAVVMMSSHGVPPQPAKSGLAALWLAPIVPGDEPRDEVAMATPPPAAPVVKDAAPPDLSGAQAQPRPDASASPSAQEAKLMQRVRAAVGAGNGSVARQLLELHSREFGSGRFVDERRDLLEELGVTPRAKRDQSAQGPGAKRDPSP